MGNNATGTMDLPAESITPGPDYLHLESTGSPVAIHVRHAVLDGIAGEAAEGRNVNGFLFGRTAAESIWIDRYGAGETAGQSVGVYRQATSPDPSANLTLLIHLSPTAGPSGQFFLRLADGSPVPLGAAFQLRDNEATRQRTPLPELPSVAKSETEEITGDRRGPGRLRKWLPFAAALLLVAGAVGFLLQTTRRIPIPRTDSTVAAEPARPLGLSVDPSGDAWRVLWNPNATVLRDARNVRLFVREKEDQNRIDLQPNDLSSGSYQYRPMGSDVTFRMEVLDKAGQISAESFRVLKEPAPAPAAPPDRGTPPKATYRAAPVVAAGIRPRIHGRIPVDVRVRVDARGRVVSAEPLIKHRSGLEKYLDGRAVEAAKQWRFEPARENGKPVAAGETIHFVFGR